MTAFLSVSVLLSYSNQYRLEIKQNQRPVSSEAEIQVNVKPNTYFLSKPDRAECRVPPSAELTALESTPSGYTAHHQQYAGYPSPSAYSAVTSLQWDPSVPAYHHVRTSAYQEGYEYHTRLLPSQWCTLDSTITNRYEESLIPLPSVMEWIKGEPVTIFVTQYGEVVAWQPEQGYKKWSRQLPVNENITGTLATYTIRSRTYLLLTTDRQYLYQLDLETGREERRVVLEERVQGPLQVLENNQSVLLVWKGESSVYGWDLVKWQPLFKKREVAFSDLSPFIVQIMNQACVILPFNSGKIEALSLQGDTIWETELASQIPFDIALLVRDGSPYIAASTLSPAIVILRADTGFKIHQKTIPGSPLSPLVFGSNHLSVSLVVRTKEGVSGFFSTSLENRDTRDTWCPIPLERCLAIVGFQTEKESNYLIINEKLGWIVTEKGMKRLPVFPPKTLSDRVPDTTFLHRNPGVWVHGALLINLGKAGFCMVGHPYPPLSVQPSEYKHTGTSREANHTDWPYSNQSSRTDLDRLPEFRKIKSLRLTIPHTDDRLPLLNSVHWVDTLTGNSFTLVPVVPDTMVILDAQMQIWYSFSIGYGSILTEPILEQQLEGGLRIWVTTNKALLEVHLSSTLRQHTVVVLAEDVSATGGSFLKCTRPNGFDLVWVDDRNQLIVFSLPEKTIRYKEPVDAKNLALQCWDGEQYLFCGSKVFRFADGQVVSRQGISGSASAVIPFQGRLYWIQSTEDDIVCRDGISNEMLWFVRKLWCKSYCFFRSNPSVMVDFQSGSVVIADYTRVVSIDLFRGVVQWSFQTRDDVFLSQPAMIKTPDAYMVYAGSVKGRLYGLDAKSGELKKGFPIQLPGTEEPREVMKGASAPILANGALWIQRKEYGLIQFGSSFPSFMNFAPIRFQVRKRKEAKKIFSCWIRSILYWDGSFTFSNRIKIIW